MFDLITIGSISIDLFFQGQSLTFKDNRFQLAIGGKYFADRIIESIGGGGANVAIGAAKHGLKTSVFGKIGNNPFKKMIIDRLHQNDVSTKFCHLENNYRNISTILLAPNGERSIINYSTSHQHIIENKQDWYKLAHTKAVYMGNLPDVPLAEKIEILSFLRKKNILTMVNFGVYDCRRPKEQLRKLFANIDILIINNHEFSEMVKAPVTDINFSDNIVKWYIPFLKETIVVVTAGKYGSYAYHLDNVYHEKACRVDHIIDTTGAGDAYCGGFISHYLKTKNIAESMKSGGKYAAKIISKIGAN